MLETEQMYNAIKESIELGKKVIKTVMEDAVQPQIRLINIYNEDSGPEKGSLIQVFYQEVVDGDNPGIWFRISFKNPDGEWSAYITPIARIKEFSESLVDLQQAMIENGQGDLKWDWRVLNLKGKETVLEINVKENGDTDEQK